MNPTDANEIRLIIIYFQPKKSSHSVCISWLLRDLIEFKHALLMLLLLILLNPLYNFEINYLSCVCKEHLDDSQLQFGEGRSRITSSFGVFACSACVCVYVNVRVCTPTMPSNRMRMFVVSPYFTNPEIPFIINVTQTI